MNKKLIPTWYCKNILELNIEKLRALDCKVILCDVDNTLASPFQATATDEVKEFVKNIQKLAMEVVLLSNNKEERVRIFANDLGVKYLYEVKKPKPNKVFQYLVDNDIKLEHVVSIGDQIMTDVLCANRVGVKVILVDRLFKKEQFITFFPRQLDKVIRYFLKKKKLLKEL